MSRPVAPALVLVLLLVATACTTGGGEDVVADDLGAGELGADDGETGEEEIVTDNPRFPAAPPVPSGPLDPALRDTIDTLTTVVAVPDLAAIEALGAGGDARVLWLLSDVLRVAADQATYDTTTDAASQLSGLDLRALDDFSWGPLTDHLIAWDLPAYDGYPADKAAVFTVIEPGWQPFFDAEPSQIDWRLTSWGGVRIDDRPLGDPAPCERGCIPSLDDPPLTPAAEGGWYPDDLIVFGVRIGEQTVALPRNIMEVHEMVNATIGGRRVAIPYCTLCGAAQVFFTDVEGGGTGDIVMRTSGLLHRSNKVMYDLISGSVFDTFTGAAISGPLLDEGVVLDQATVVTSTWADWREAHPDTTIVAEDGGIGRRYPLDPLRGRDDDGPIFPIGDRDGRLGVHDQVVGVITDDGTPLAFPVASARAVLEEGGEVSTAGVRLRQDAGGLVAVREDGGPLPSHQAFWFAWSQFHPDTLLWDGTSG